jgi:hypothetical protein
MRRVALVLLALVLATAVGVPAAGAATAHAAPTTRTAAGSMPAFCRSTDRFVRFLAHAPDPRQLATAKGRRVLRALHDDAPAEVSAATGTVVASFGYLSRHGAHSLSKARDTRTADALLRAAVFAASHCRQRAVRQLAQGLVQRKLAQAEAANPPAGSTPTTTVAR